MTTGTLRLLDASDRSRQAGRLERFLASELPLLLGVLLVAVLLTVYYGHVAFVAMAVAVATHAAVLVLALRWARQERLEIATLAVCSSLWLLSMTIAFFAPMVWTATLMLIIRSAILALPYLPRRSLRRALLLATGGALVVCLLALRGDPFGLLNRVPGGVADGIVIATTFAALSLDLLLLWQNGERLKDTIAALRDSERTLEANVAARTAQLARATHEAEREKQYSEALIHNSPVAIVVTDAGAQVVTWNPAAETLFGYPAAEAIGRRLDALIANDPEIQADVLANIHDVKAETPIHAITQRTRRDGTLADVEIWGVPVVVDEEETRALGMYHDRAEIKQAQEALQESYRQLADIIDFMPDAVLVIDADGKVISWNRALEEMTGVKAEEMLGKGDYAYALPFYGERRPILIDLVTTPRKELEEKYAQIRSEGPVLLGETYVPKLREGGSYLLGAASALRDSKGQVVGAIEVIRDFTERKQIEETLEQSKDAAEAATQAKSAFLATMSHEIRTPMNAIIGMSGLLMDTDLSEDQRDFAETIRSSGEALLTIINDILDFSKMEAGKMDLEEQPFDLGECVESALDLMRLRASQKGLELACDIKREVPPAIVGDVTRLRQILVNLLSNAVKFTEQGEVVVTVSADGLDQQQTTDGKRQTKASSVISRRPSIVRLHFSVRDTGIGIPPGRVDRLFRAFSQVDASTTRKYGGTGLGLAVSKRLAEMMGGTMWAESEGVPGRGSTFHVTISAPPAPDWEGAWTLEGEQPQLSGRRLLIVDDNATNRRILALQTRAWGMDARAAATSGEALAWLRRGDAFDLAILDLQMPDMDGVELAEAIRKLETETGGTARLPLVLFSSLGGRETARKSAEFIAVLPKPVRRSTLFDVLMTVFAEQPGRAAGPRLEPTKVDPGIAARHPLRILLAEDNLVNQKVALRMLSKMGYRADVAANGMEAVQAVERQPYDAILMDVQMPEMDGLEATRHISTQLIAGERPRIIAMTANAMEGDREMCLEAGMDDYVSKPVRVEELVAALRRCQPRPARQKAREEEGP